MIKNNNNVAIGYLCVVVMNSPGNGTISPVGSSPYSSPYQSPISSPTPSPVPSPSMSPISSPGTSRNKGSSPIHAYPGKYLVNHMIHKLTSAFVNIRYRANSTLAVLVGTAYR